MMKLLFITGLFGGAIAFATEAFFISHHKLSVPSRRLSRLDASATLTAATLQKHTSRTEILQESPATKESQQMQKWQHLYETTTNNGSDVKLLRLQQDTEGYRGVYLNEAVKTGEIVLSIPLTSCLRDDKPPAWFCSQSGDWATGLAASLLERQMKSKSDDLWLSLLPNSAILRASLPVHWSEDILKSAASTVSDVNSGREWSTCYGS
jgi:hypothetical protein